jgi:hypothetical protein
MTRLQLEAIVETYNMLEKGLTNPIKINQVYNYINPMVGVDVPIRAKIMAIKRFMIVNYNDVMRDLATPKIEETQDIVDSMGTMENKPFQSHTEATTHDVASEDMSGFLTTEEKQDLKSEETGTVFEVRHADGKITRSRTKKNGDKPKRTRIVKE